MQIIAYLWSFLVKISAKFIIKSRLKKALEEPERFKERFGKCLLHRPNGKIVWLHGASVGEALSLLPLIEKILKFNSSLHVLVTTTTVSSAKIFEKRMPKRCFHQYIPYDSKKYVRNFLKHWKPSAAIFVESELWPNIILSLKNKGIPAFLINARLSENSFKTWKKFSLVAKKILNSFQYIYTQSDKFTVLYKKLGAKKVSTIGNIKCLSNPLPCNDFELKEWQKYIDSRPCWIAASTHKNEEEIIIKIHNQVKQFIPNILTIIAPRHVERSTQIFEQFSNVNKISLFSTPKENSEILIVNEYSKLGIFYRICSFAFIGNSLIKKGGGHNPIEPSMLNCMPIWGSNFQNFEDMMPIFEGIPCEQENEEILQESVIKYLTNKKLAEKYTNKINARILDCQKNIHKTVSEIIANNI